MRISVYTKFVMAPNMSPEFQTQKAVGIRCRIHYTKGGSNYENRKNFDKVFKAKVVLEALREELF